VGERYEAGPEAEAGPRPSDASRSRVVQTSSGAAAESKFRTAAARIVSARAGVKQAQASHTRWESESERLEPLVSQRVLVQVCDEAHRPFEEDAA
jgi:hypothetical protein